MQDYFKTLKKEQKAKTTKNTKAKEYASKNICYISYRIYNGKIRMQLTNAKYATNAFLDACDLDIKNAKKQVYTLIDSNKAKLIEQLAKEDSKAFMQNSNAFLDIEQKAKEQKTLAKLASKKEQKAKEQAKDNK